MSDATKEIYKKQNLDLSSEIASHLFEFSYRPKHRVQQDIVVGEDISSTKKRCIEWCQRHDINFIYVRPLILNLDWGMRDKDGFQKEKEDA